MFCRKVCTSLLSSSLISRTLPHSRISVFEFRISFLPILWAAKAPATNQRALVRRASSTSGKLAPLGAAFRFPGVADSNPASSNSSPGNGGNLPSLDGLPFASRVSSALATRGSTSSLNASPPIPTAFAAATLPSLPPPSTSSSAPARKPSGIATMDAFADPFVCAASAIPLTAKLAPRAFQPKPPSPRLVPHPLLRPLSAISLHGQVKHRISNNSHVRKAKQV